ncbi:MAG: aldo/keto reductase [Armatimonadota bacterium]|nr:aldo/keto reductase [Armatimonadota bacterium]
MELTRLGRTDLMVTRTSFGLLPLQRVEMNEAVRILNRACDAGITFYDTARGYSDTEEKLGRALSGRRDSIVIATKNAGPTRSQLLAELETSLRNLRADHVDLMQLHNPRALPDPDDPESSYAGLLEAREKGMARFIGFTSHSLERAIAAVDSGLYDTVQYPICHISSEEDLDIVRRCREAGVGVIAMKPMCGGIITQMRPAFAFLRGYENVVPIWGIQRMSELDELLELDADPPALDDELLATIEQDRRELAEDFCRGCGYCLPCPAEIPINMAARMSHLLRRMPYQGFLSDEWRDYMLRIENCTDCGSCRARCPYDLDTPALLRKALADYRIFYREHTRGPLSQ